MMIRCLIGVAVGSASTVAAKSPSGGSGRSLLQANSAAPQTAAANREPSSLRLVRTASVMCRRIGSSLVAVTSGSLPAADDTAGEGELCYSREFVTGNIASSLCDSSGAAPLCPGSLEHPTFCRRPVRGPSRSCAVTGSAGAAFKPTLGVTAPALLLQRRMASLAPRHRPVTGQVRRGLAMTAETEVVEARFGADPDGRAAAAVTTDARICPASIDEIVMTGNAVHRAMFLVRKAQN